MTYTTVATVTPTPTWSRITLHTADGYTGEENHASQALCQRSKLRHTGMAAAGVQVWSRELIISAEDVVP